MTSSSTQAIDNLPVAIRRLAATGVGWLRRIPAMICFAGATIGRGYARRWNLRVVSQLDDRLLLDIGFNRSDIERQRRGGQ